MPDKYNKAYHGIIFTANTSGVAQAARSDSGSSYSCANNFYGYEVKSTPATTSDKIYSGYQESSLFKIKESTLASGSITVGTTHQSSDADFIKNFTFCNSVLYTILNKGIYKISGDTFSYSTSEAEAEVRPYLPAMTAIHSIDQALYNPMYINDLFVIMRKFDVSYGVNQDRVITKLSRIETERRNGTPSLFMKNSGISGGINLFYKTVEFKSSNIPLTTYGSILSSSGFSLHLEAGTRSVLPLYIKTIEPNVIDSSIGLNIYSTLIPSVYNKSNTADLLMNGVVSYAENTLNLSLFAPNISDVSGSMTLSMTNELKSSDDNLSIFIQNDQLSIEESASLFTVSVLGNSSNALNLTLYRQGITGGSEIQKDLGLNMKNKIFTSNISIYTDGILANNSSCNLVMSKGYEIPSRDVSLNMFGYQD